MKIGGIIGLSVLALSLSLSIAGRVFADGGDTTLIHGCVNNNTKATRIVGANANCQNNENARHWPTAARIVTDETRITNTENKNTTQDSAISAIQTKNTQQDAAIAALQGQVGGGSSAVVVKDSQGQVVGKLIGQHVGSGYPIFRQIGNTPLLFHVFPVGYNLPNSVYFAYTTNNCIGTRYMFSSVADGGDFFELPQSTDSVTAYFPALPAQQISYQSVESFGPGQDPSGVGICQPQGTSIPANVGTVSTINLLTFATFPLHVE